MAGEAEGSVESCEHGCWGLKTPRGKCDALGLRGCVRDLYAVFALPNPVVRDAPSPWGRCPTFVHGSCSGRRSWC